MLAHDPGEVTSRWCLVAIRPHRVHELVAASLGSQSAKSLEDTGATTPHCGLQSLVSTMAYNAELY